MPTLDCPFPWYGGKRRIAADVWQAFGPVSHYIEPFFGSGAVLFAKEADIHRLETVNDKDGYVANAWRAMQYDPQTVAHYADQPVFENDLHARHAWLLAQKGELVARLEGDPAYFDPQVAGYCPCSLRQVSSISRLTPRQKASTGQS